jgi:two-component system phosphate regulon sensor histidine kinase PhoR
VHHSIIQHIPIDKRASLQQIENLLREELTKAGIATDYVYGVFSLSRDSFLFRRSFCPDLDLSDYERPQNFGYWMQLFPSSEQAEAVLHIEFPHRKQFVWRGIIFHLLGTLLLAAIIIFCFYYTIRIIYNQKKVSEMKTDFLNNMTHEFKTPIATISLASDAIRSLLGGQKYDKIDRFVRIIKEENARMLTQVEQVLQIARIEKRDLRLKLQDVDLRALVEKAISSISLQVEKREGTIKTEFLTQKTLLQADETHLTNAVLNLLDNANKYSPNAPRITLRVADAPNGRGILLSVSDEGMGISKEAIKNVFEAFYRVSTGNLHDVKGFGLGLSYVKSIATAHGGDVRVQSELGKGSTFTLELPYVNPKAEGE